MHMWCSADVPWKWMGVKSRRRINDTNMFEALQGCQGYIDWPQ